jgi:GNAT superfamily N-acetyltransferase
MTAAGDMTDAGLSIRPARADEVPALERLIMASARALSRGYYSQGEIELLIAHIFGVDTELVADGSYFLAEHERSVIGCGGWSRRRTLFGGDRFDAREAGYLDPAVDAARIRAFFVAPDHARKGVATGLLDACERAAAGHNFTRTTLMATLPGVPFYLAAGYRAAEPIQQLCGGSLLQLVPMNKTLRVDNKTTVKHSKHGGEGAK